SGSWSYRPGAYDKMISEHLFPDARQSVEYTFCGQNGRRMLECGWHHQTNGHGCRLDLRNLVTCRTKQFVPTVPHVKTNMCSVEQTLFVLREAPQQNVAAKPEIPDVWD